MTEHTEDRILTTLLIGWTGLAIYTLYQFYQFHRYLNYLDKEVQKTFLKR